MEFIIRAAAFLLYVIYKVLNWFYGKIYHTKPPGIPKAKNPLLQLSAATLARRIRHGEISSEEVVEAYIERIKEVNPVLNAVVDQRFEEALCEARDYDAKLRAGEVTVLALEKEKPLYGVPFTVKESCALKGLSFTGCTLPRKDIKASDNGVAVAALIKAGAIPLGVTNTPELCSSFHSANYVYGGTSNPYNVRLTSGGSSGGEGAIIGAGASLIGIGSDLAGSIRVPAHFNGIFGHKPTPGIIPIRGHFPMSDDPAFQTTLTLGPMTRYAEDLHLAVKALSSGCGIDLHLDEPVDIRSLRVFHMDAVESFLDMRTPSPEIRQSINNAVRYLVESGAQLQESPIPPMAMLGDNLFPLVTEFFAIPRLPPLLIDPNHPERVISAGLEMVKAMFGCSKYTKTNILSQIIINRRLFTSSSNRNRAHRLVEDAKLQLINLLKDDGVLIYPTYPSPALHKRLAVLRMDCCSYCLLANIFGLPSTHVPMGLNKEGLPIGLQVIAGPKQDRLCLAVAKELEKEFGGWRPPVSD